MVKHLLLVLSLGACTALPETKRPDLIDPAVEIPELEMIEPSDLQSFEYPQEVETLLKAAPSVVPFETDKGTQYREATELDQDNIMVVITVEEMFLIKDLFVAARENKNLADKLLRLQELSIEERNQLLRILKAEAYRQQRTQAFTDYYKAEVERIEKASAIESWSLKILTALALLVAI